MNVKERVMLAAINISKYEGRKRDKDATDEIIIQKNARKGSARVNKDLFTKEALSPINTAAADARAMHYKLTLPWSDDGYRILSVDLYQEYLAEMMLIKRRFEEAVIEFIKNYDMHVEESKRNLGNMWNPYEYPTRAEVAAKFRFDLKLMPLPDATDFRVDIAKEEIILIQQDIKRRVDESLAAALKDAVSRLYSAMKHMADKLADQEAQFHYTLVENVREMIDLLPKFNFINDPTLTQLANEAKVLVAHNADTLRNNVTVRSETAVKARSLVNKIEGWM